MQLLKKTLTYALIMFALLLGFASSAIAGIDVYFLSRAINQGDTFSQSVLATLYEDEKDYQKAIYWFEKAADQGDSLSQHKLGTYYLEGKIIQQDYSKAVWYFKKSANQKYIDSQSSTSLTFSRFSQFQLGMLYEFGDVVRQNKTVAKEWYGKACDNGYRLGCSKYRILNTQGY